MKANELRIGNLLQSDTNTIIKIVGVVKKDIYYYHNKKNLYVLELNNLNFQPLELTEEWLLKFGFGDARITNRLYTRKKTDGFYGFYINKETMSYCTFDYEGTIDDIIKIEYVHQLQNLYFAVTGEELTMK
jgi:hypothetical protein